MATVALTRCTPGEGLHGCRLHYSGRKVRVVGVLMDREAVATTVETPDEVPPMPPSGPTVLQLKHEEIYTD